MINLSLLRESPARVIALIRKKEPAFDIELLYELDQQVRALLSEVEALRKKKNELAEIGKMGVTQDLRDQSIAVGKKLKQTEHSLSESQKQFDELYLGCPNIPFDDVPPGDKADNVAVKVVGEKPEFAFHVKNHVELNAHLGWVDFEAGVRMAGSQFPCYKDMGARLIYALTTMMLKNNIKHGFQVMLPPCVANETALTVASNFPKFRENVYEIPADNLFLSPTAEVVLTNMYREHIFGDGALPVRMTAWTSCFRREAGGYGATERGLIRIHQFEKVELYTICEPKDSTQEHERMVACAEDILQQLGLHYRVSLLAAQDCSFPSAKTYDIEVWLPGQKAYYEVSSSSNCTDFQARRGSIRYKKHDMRKTELVHTLNTSSLAIPRLMVALLETYQQEDGSVVLPEVLNNFLL